MLHPRQTWSPFFITMIEDLFDWSEQQQLQPLPKRNPKAAIPLPMEMIRESLELDPTSPSHLRWKTRPRHHFNREKDWKMWNRRFAGKAIETVLPVGGGKKYWKLEINYTTYKAHRVVYALALGVDPGTLHIDHIDGDGLNNAPDNLRLATPSENQRNRGAQQNNTSGIKGAWWHKQARKWQAQICLNGHRRHIGIFDTLEAAAAAYERAAEALHGEFARTA